MDAPTAYAEHDVALEEAAQLEAVGDNREENNLQENYREESYNKYRSIIYRSTVSNSIICNAKKNTKKVLNAGGKCI